MPSPVTPAEFEDAVPAANASLCTKFMKFFQVPQLVADVFSWILTSTGAISEEFKAEVATYSAPPGTVIYCLTQNVGNGWLECNGQEVSRTTYAALFTAIGTRYGDGDGSTTFALPDFRGRSPIGAGTGSGLTNRDINTKYIGEESHTQTAAELVAHTHSWVSPLTKTGPRGDGANICWTSASTENTGSTGGGQPFNVIQPSFIGFVFVKT